MSLILAIVAGVCVSLFLFKFFFDDFGNFVDCIVFWLTPDILSLIRREWAADQWAEIRLFFGWDCPSELGFLCVCGSIGCSVE